MLFWCVVVVTLRGFVAYGGLTIGLVLVCGWVLILVDGLYLCLGLY